MDPPIIVTATEANRNFAKLLRAVERGERVAITSHGRKVAEVIPPEVQATEMARRAAAYAELKRHWASLEPVTVGPWTREDLNQR